MASYLVLTPPGAPQIRRGRRGSSPTVFLARLPLSRRSGCLCKRQWLAGIAVPVLQATGGYPDLGCPAPCWRGFADRTGTASARSRSKARLLIASRPGSRRLDATRRSLRPMTWRPPKMIYRPSRRLRLATAAGRCRSGTRRATADTADARHRTAFGLFGIYGER